MYLLINSLYYATVWIKYFNNFYSIIICLIYTYLFLFFFFVSNLDVQLKLYSTNSISLLPMRDYCPLDVYANSIVKIN